MSPEDSNHCTVLYGINPLPRRCHVAVPTYPLRNSGSGRSRTVGKTRFDRHLDGTVYSPSSTAPAIDSIIDLCSRNRSFVSSITGERVLETSRKLVLKESHHGQHVRRAIRYRLLEIKHSYFDRTL